MMSWEGLNPPYSTIVADPPWKYSTKAGITTNGRHRRSSPDAPHQYATMTLSELASLQVAQLAADNSHLYLWTTNPKLPYAFSLMALWGFRYVTMITWWKQGNVGMGFYWRGDTEHILFGVRGKAPIHPSKRERNIFQAPKQGHSIKPGRLMDLVERVSPGPYVELFARQPRLGWDSWGYGYEGKG